MNRKLTVVAVSLCAFIHSGALLAGNEAASPELEKVINSHIAATSMDSESIEDVMKTIHSDSPAAMHIKTALEQAFPVFDMNVSLAEFSFVGMDGDYAVARVKQQMEKVSGPASFKDQVAEKLYVFRQEQGQWKIWQAVMLDVEHL